MGRKFNFYSGPATLPAEVLEEVQGNLLDYRGMGMSLMETSHRSAEYQEVQRAVISKIRALLELPEDYDVLLMGGGATLQFSMVPLNIMAGAGGAAAADFVNSGAWAQKAIADAERYGRVRVIWEDEKAETLPDPASIDSEASYLHITSNETINGLQWKSFPHCSAPLVADMSSDILSRPLDIKRFGLIYAGAQKNLGPSGLTVVIIRRDLLDRCPAPDALGAYLNYRTHARAESLYNTPPVFSVWVTSLVLSWIKERGGVRGMAAINEKKAAALYSAIENSDGFYRSPVAPEFRSTMNVVFTLKNADLETAFLSGAAERNMVGLKGHRSLGGFRASIYNAMPLEGAQALANYMREFAAERG